MHAIAIREKRAHESEGEWGGLYERVGREGGNVKILLNLKNKKWTRKRYKCVRMTEARAILKYKPDHIICLLKNLLMASAEFRIKSIFLNRFAELYTTRFLIRISDLISLAPCLDHCVLAMMTCCVLWTCPTWLLSPRPPSRCSPPRMLDSISDDCSRKIFFNSKSILWIHHSYYLCLLYPF